MSNSVDNQMTKKLFSVFNWEKTCFDPTSKNIQYLYWLHLTISSDASDKRFVRMYKWILNLLYLTLYLILFQYLISLDMWPLHSHVQCIRDCSTPLWCSCFYNHLSNSSSHTYTYQVQLYPQMFTWYMTTRKLWISTPTNQLLWFGVKWSAKPIQM